MLKKNSKIAKSNFTVKKLFDIKRGNGKYIKKYINEHKGAFPVYSGNTFGSFAYIDTFDYRESCISWAIDGLAGYIMVHNGKFSVTNHRGVLFPKIDGINLKYCKFILEPLFRQAKKGRIGVGGDNEYTALPPFMIENIEFPMPINKNGTFDMPAQEELVEKYEFVSDVKLKIAEYQQNINNLNVDIGLNFTFKVKKIADIFDVEKGKQFYTNEYITRNRGKYPLYSSQTTNEGIRGHINTFDYDCIAITWTTDGVYAGTVFLRNNKFSMTTYCGALVLKKTSTNINIEYVYYFLKNILKIFAEGEQNKRVTVRIIKEITIPIDSNGDFDLSAQKEIADKYRKIEQIKKNVSEELNKIINSVIELK